MRFQFFSLDTQTDDRQQTTDDRQTDKTDCLTPLHACAHGVTMLITHLVVMLLLIAHKNENNERVILFCLCGYTKYTPDLPIPIAALNVNVPL